jgi:hypothetical protein
MGATTFETMSHGKTAEEAFSAAVDAARYEYGHGGYTGSIAEKYDFALYTLPPRVMAPKVIAALYEAVAPEVQRMEEQYRAHYGRKQTAEQKRYDRKAAKAFEWLASTFGERTARGMIGTFNDKSGPAVAFEVTGKARDRYRLYHHVPRGRKVFVFVGWAPY